MTADAQHLGGAERAPTLHGVGEVGYVLRAPFRGRGLMREALALVVDHGFERIDLSTITAHTAVDNMASIALLRRAGFEETASAGALLTFVRHRAGRAPPHWPVP